ncbi:hypothetical protein DMUE_3142 [Dictyocoela muelleri]|nr:hypothetical protein DMUE_3142 [Dictyocoela muelleri]
MEVDLADIISSDCYLTQLGMVKKLSARGMEYSQPSISLLLSKMNISRKRLVSIADKKNDTATSESRHQFSIKYRRYDNDDLLYLDETGFRLHSKRAYEYSPVNLPARITVKANKRRNVSLMCLISVRGNFIAKLLMGLAIA